MKYFTTNNKKGNNIMNRFIFYFFFTANICQLSATAELQKH